MPDPTDLDLLRGANLYLVGMMGVGKSTIGRLAAQRMGYRFVDTDTVIEQAAQQSIAEIFAAAGETAFRELESQILSQLSPYSRMVVATGGGIVLDQENWWHLRQGVVVWLDVSVAELVRRLQGDTRRPLLKRPDWQTHVANLLNERQQRYAEADIRLTVQPGEPKDAVCDRLIAALQARILPPPTLMPPDG
ncbi:MAG: shikimate kinase [Leptolyngbyaceae cyanobacterium]